jgi:hypothetical protein
MNKIIIANPASYGLLPGVYIRMLASNLPGQYHLLLTVRAKDPPRYLGYEQVYPRWYPFLNTRRRDRKIHFCI